MANPRKSPRLYLRKRPHRKPVWVILDGGYEQALCLREEQKDEAAVALHDYIESTGRVAVGANDRRGYIYFLTADTANFPIKIGFSRGPTICRMSTLQNGCPYPLVSLGVMRGTASEERSLHRRFEQWRLKGEWFERCPNLLDFIRSAATVERQILSEA